jgi:transposase
MPEPRRKFSPQIKAEAVQMVLGTGKPIAEVARDLGINEGALGTWVNIWHRENLEPTTELTPVERARVKEMEDVIRRRSLRGEGSSWSLTPLPETSPASRHQHASRLAKTSSQIWPSPHSRASSQHRTRIIRRHPPGIPNG